MQKDKEPGNNKFTLPDLIKRLKSGDLDSIKGGFHLIDSAPDLEGDFEFGPDGFPEVSFGQKFEEDFAGWQFGERVRSKYKVKRNFNDSGEPVYELLVSDNVVGDIRHADIFVLNSLSEVDKVALDSIGMADLEAVVEIRDGFTPHTRASNMQVYDARIDRIVSIQEVWDGDETKLVKGENYLVEGKVVSYEVDREYPYTDAVITLKMGTGEVVRIILSNGYLNYERGVFENFIPLEPEEGDLVQINTTFGNWRDRYGDDGENNLYAYFCRSTHLLEPSEDRRSRNEDQRRFVEERINEIESLDDPDEIRRVISRLARSSITEEKRLDITNQERVELERSINRKFPRVEDRPLDFLEHTSQMLDFNLCYGEDSFSMSRREFYQVCERIAEGDYAIQDRGSSDSVWALMFYHFSAEENGLVISTAVNNFFTKVIGKRFIQKENILEDPENILDLHKKEYGHRIGRKVVIGEKDYDPEELADPNNVISEIEWLYKQALGYLSRTITAEVSEVYMNVLTQVYENRLFMKDSRDRFLVFAEYEHFNAIERNILGNLIWEDNQFGTRINGYRNSAAIDVYVKALPQLRSLAELMDKEGWKNEGVRDPAKHVLKIIKYLEIVQEDMRDRNARWN